MSASWSDCSALRLGQHAGGRLGRHHRRAQRDVQRIRHAALEHDRHQAARPRRAARELPGDVRRGLGTRARHLLRGVRSPAPGPCRADAWRDGCARRRRSVGRRAWCRTRRGNTCAPRWRISAGPGISARSSAPAMPLPTSRIRRRSCWRSTQLGCAADRAVWYLGDTALDMRTARAAGVTAVLIGDAAHDGGIDRAHPDLHFPTALDLAARLRELV